MNKTILIEGFWERLNEACKKDGRSKSEIARACGFNRKVLYWSSNKSNMHVGYMVKFCAETNTSADWLLGLRRSEQ